MNFMNLSADLSVPENRLHFRDTVSRVVNDPHHDAAGAAGGKVILSLVGPETGAEVPDGHAAFDLMAEGIEDEDEHGDNAVLVISIHMNGIAFLPW